MKFMDFLKDCLKNDIFRAEWEKDFPDFDVDGLLNESMEKKVINIREELNRLDYETNCQYDLINLYEAAELDTQARKDLVKFLAQGEDADFIGNFLSKKYGAKCSDDLCEATFAESRDNEEDITGGNKTDRSYLRKSSTQKEVTLTESSLRIDDYDISDREKLTVGWDKDKGFVVSKIWRPTTDTNTWKTEWERTYTSEDGAKRAFKRYISKLSEDLSSIAPLEKRKPYRVFAVGDRVKVVNADGWSDFAKEDIGRVGTIIAHSYQGIMPTYTVEFDKPVERVAGYKRYNSTTGLFHDNNIDFAENLDEAKDTEKSRANRRDKISGKFNVPYTLTLKNQYNYTVIQYMIDPKNKTIEKGLFNWGDGKGSFFKNRKELQRHIDDLLAQGYKMIESKEEGLKEDTKTKAQSDGCQTIEAYWDDNRKALVISKEEWEDWD